MSRQEELVAGQTPHMEVVNAVNLWHGEDVATNMVRPHLGGRALHEDVKTLHESGNRGEHHQDRKEEGAERVNDQPVWLEHDDECGDDDANRLEQVANQVDNGRLNVDVHRLVVMVVVVTMSVVLVCRVVMLVIMMIVAVAALVVVMRVLDDALLVIMVMMVFVNARLDVGEFGLNRLVVVFVR